MADSDIPAEQHMWCPFCTHTEWVMGIEYAADFIEGKLR
jgi:hypothetical protein